MLLQQPPYVDHRVFEAIDALLVAAAFEQQVSILFRGAGVTGLLAAQAPQDQRSLAKILQSLETYEVNSVYAHEESLAAHRMTAGDCVIPVQTLNSSQVAELIASQDMVLTD